VPVAERVLLGVIVGAKGIRGEVKIKSFTEDPENIAAYGPLEDASGKTTFKVKVVGFSKGLPVARIAGISDRTAAEALKGTELYVARERLPETEDGEEYYHADLIGLAVFFRDGTKLGTIERVFDFGAGDMLDVRPDPTSSNVREAVLVPFTAERVPVVDVAGGRVVVDLEDGFFSVPDRRAEGSDV